ncbi:TOMM precursor leader peptide-binding protein [Nonomuraea sp. NPDC004702]
MVVKPALRPAFHAQIVAEEGVFLLSERDQFVLTGRLYRLLAPFLDGSRDVAEIVHSLAGEATAVEVHYALRLLERKGYIVEGADVRPPGGGPADRIAFWHGLGVPSGPAERRLSEVEVVVTALGSVDAGPLERALAEAGVRLARPTAGSPPGTGSGRFAVVATDDYLRDELAAVNAEATAAGRPWLLVKPAGTILWIGPVFHPGRTACWECLSQRLRGNRRVESYLRLRSGAPVIPPGGLTGGMVTEAGARLAAVETVKVIGRGLNLAPDASLVTFDLADLQAETHRVARLPQCPACGDARARDVLPAPPALRSRTKAYTLDGGHRAVTPDETLAAYQHHVSPLTGAVMPPRSVPVAGDGLIRFYAAAHHSPLVAHDLTELRGLLQDVSAGKGVSDTQARASVLAEALERYSGYFWGDEPRERASRRELGDAAILPGTCMLFSDRQYARRAEHNKTGSLYEVVPAPFDEDAKIEWTPVWSLTAGAHKFLPTEYCYGYFVDPAQEVDRYCLADSNGNAAGNTLEEAILQGFMELVERDGVALWWYNRLRRPAVELGGLRDGTVQELCRRHRALGRDVWVLDLTNDLEIPVFAAVSQRTDGGPGEIVWGFGAHFDARIAALRALTEVSQSIPRASSRNDVHDARLDPRVREWYRTATLADHPYLAPADAPPRDYGHTVGTVGDDLYDDVRRCQEIVERHGMELLVLDQTRPEIGLPVVKVVVPGLRHFRPRLAPGRLYDVPVRLGWLDAPLGEAELNPLPYVFP